MISQKQAILKNSAPECEEAYEFLKNHRASEKECECALMALYHLNTLAPDVESQIACLLFQIPEITEEDLKDIRKKFGVSVMNLVKCLMRFSRIHYAINTTDKRKTFIKQAMMMLLKDGRAIYIKIATRLAKLEVQRPTKGASTKELAQEAFDIHIPLANLLGLWDIKCQLEDTAFQQINPEEHNKISLYRSHKIELNSEYIHKIENTLNTITKASNIEYKFKNRLKNIYEIYKKQERKFNSNSLKDILAFEIAVPSRRDCYRMLGVIHSIWKPQHKNLKDYIAIPKLNGYQALHTTVFGPDERTCLFQITSYDILEKQIPHILKDSDLHKKIHEWIKVSMENSYTHDAQIIWNKYQNPSLEKNIFVFTDKGDIVNLPYGATVIDAAYQIGTYLGNHFSQAYIDGMKVLPNHVLQTGETLEIYTSRKTPGPKSEWLEFANTEKAQKGIQQFLKKQSHEDQINLATEKLDHILQKFFNSNLKNMRKNIEARISKSEKYSNLDDALLAIGSGSLSRREFISSIFSEKELLYSKKNPPNHNREVGIVVYCYDNVGMLRDISNKIATLGMNMTEVSTKGSADSLTATIYIKVQVEGFLQLYDVLEKLEEIPGIIKVAKD